MRFLLDLFTTADGKTGDLGRILLAIGCLVMAAGGIASIVRGTLDFIAFGTGFGGLLTGGGALLILKHPTEPSVKTTTVAAADDAAVKVEENG